MFTVKEWIEFMSRSKSSVKIGLKKDGGVFCRHYYFPEEALKQYDGWLDEIVIQAFPMNFIKDDIQYCLLTY